MFTKFRAASCHFVAPCPCFASCHCCPDPFIVREVPKLVHRSLVSLSLHISVLMFTTNVDICLFLCHNFPCTFLLCYVFVSGLQSSHQLRDQFVIVILLWSVGSMVSRIPILQTCNVVEVLKHRLASFQHLRKFLL